MGQPTAGDSILTFIASRHEILLCNQKMGTSAESFAALSRSCGEAIAKTVRNHKPQSSCVHARMMSLVVEGPMLESDKTNLIAVLNTLLVDGPGEGLPTGSNATQTNHFIYNYFTPTDWSILHQSNFDSSVQVVTARLVAVGLRNPSEKTFAMMIAVMCGDNVKDWTCEDSVMLGLLRTLKSKYKHSLQRQLCQLSNPPMIFPEDPESLARSHPLWYDAAYASEKPVKKDVGSLWNALAARVPLRSTRGSCCSMAPARRASSSKGIGESTSALYQLLSGLGRQGNDCTLPGLRIFGQHQPARDCGQPGFLALTNANPPATTNTQQLALVQAPAAPAPARELDYRCSALLQEPRVAQTTTLDQMVKAMTEQLRPTAAEKQVGPDVMDTRSMPAKLVKKSKPAKPVKKVYKKPAACVPAPAKARRSLGCSKCRFSKNGCGRCKAWAGVL